MIVGFGGFVNWQQSGLEGIQPFAVMARVGGFLN
jgi:hypothetical protein